MSNAIATEATGKPKAAKGASSPTAGFEPMQMPKFEVPAAIREFAEKSGAQAKDNCERMRAAAEEISDVIEDTYATAAKGTANCSLKVIETARASLLANFDYAGALMDAKTPSQMVELSNAHARKQFDMLFNQNRELWALLQTMATDMSKPVTAAMSSAIGKLAPSPRI